MYEDIYRRIQDIIFNIGVTSNFRDDLTQEVMLIVLEYDKEKITNLYNNNNINYFLARIIQNQYNSKTSPFFKQYRKFSSLSDELSWNNDDDNDNEYD